MELVILCLGYSVISTIIAYKLGHKDGYSDCLKDLTEVLTMHTDKNHL